MEETRLTEICSCPFCKSNKIDYSVKTRGTYYHCSWYCKSCNTYGPRVLSDKFRYGEYDKARQQRESEILKQKALDLWNTR